LKKSYEIQDSKLSYKPTQSAINQKQNHENQFFKISYYLFFVVVNFCHAIFDDLCLKKIHPILTQKNQSNPFRAIIPSSHILIPFDIHHVPLPVIVFP